MKKRSQDVPRELLPDTPWREWFEGLSPADQAEITKHAIDRAIRWRYALHQVMQDLGIEKKVIEGFAGANEELTEAWVAGLISHPKICVMAQQSLQRSLEQPINQRTLN